MHCLLRLLIGALAAASVAGCASRPINEPISHVDVESGYRASVRLPKQQSKDLNNLVLLAFSGGGTRAAAFSYGVLEELRRTEVVVDVSRTYCCTCNRLVVMTCDCSATVFVRPN